MDIQERVERAMEKLHEAAQEIADAGWCEMANTISRIYDGLDASLKQVDVSRHCPNCEAYQMRVEQLVRILNSRGNHCCCQFDAQGDTIIEWCAVHAKLQDRVAELEREIDALNADRSGGCACRFDPVTYEQTHWCSTHAKIDEEAPEP